MRGRKLKTMKMTIDECISNLKKGSNIPFKHETLTMAINSIQLCDSIINQVENIPVPEDVEPEYVIGFKHGIEQVVRMIESSIRENSEDDSGNNN